MYLLSGTLAHLPTHIPIPLVSRTRPRFFQQVVAAAGAGKIEGAKGAEGPT